MNPTRQILIKLVEEILGVIICFNQKNKLHINFKMTKIKIEIKLGTI